MKSDIHPAYHMIKVVMIRRHRFHDAVDATAPNGDTLNLEHLTPRLHPAWTGGSQQLLDRGGRLIARSTSSLRRPVFRSSNRSDLAISSL